MAYNSLLIVTNFLLTSPMHWPTHGQWWSNLWTQLLQMEQCEDRGGRYRRQVSQNFTFTAKPFTMTSLGRRNLIRGVLPSLQSMDGVLEPSSNSSASGGALVFLGIIPGSLADVMKRKTRSCIWGQVEPDYFCFRLLWQLVCLILKNCLVTDSDIKSDIILESMIVAGDDNWQRWS